MAKKKPKTEEVKLLEQQVELLKLIAKKVGCSDSEIIQTLESQPPKGSDPGEEDD